MSNDATDTSAPAPSDHTTLVDVLAGYADAGFAADFSVGEGAQIRCDSCGTTSPASGFVMHSLRRLEGASDPDDMIAVVALDCPVCGVSGTAVLSFGPAGSDADGDVLRELQDRRDGDTLPAASAPDESPD